MEETQVLIRLLTWKHITPFRPITNLTSLCKMEVSYSTRTLKDETNFSSGSNGTCSALQGNDSLSSIAAKSSAYILIFILSIVGNSLIIVIIHRERELRSTTNYLIANMSVSDLLASIFFMPIAILEIFNGHRIWPIDGFIGSSLCKMVYFIHDVSVAVSVESLTFITIDRFCGVVHPHRRKPFVGRMKKLVAFIWINSMLLHCPFLYTFQLTSKFQATYCEMIWPSNLDSDLINKIYFLTLIVLLFAMPLSVIVVLQALIIRKFYNQTLPRGLSGEARMRRHRRNCKVISMVLAVTVVFFACWSPIIVFSFITLFTNKPCPEYELIRFVASFIVESNKSWNFFIYFAFNNTYRRALASVCRCRRKLEYQNGEVSSHHVQDGDVVVQTLFQNEKDSFCDNVKLFWNYYP